MTQFALEPVTPGLIVEIEPLLQQHWREIAHFQDIPLRPDWEFYLSAKTIRVFTARQFGELVGYAVFFVSANKHYTTSLQAVQDILYVHPSKRGTLLGVRLISYCDAALRDCGVQVVYQHVKRAHDFGPLLRRLGYEEVDTIWAKRLDKG